MTEDVDVTVRVPRDKIRGLLAALEKRTFVPRVADVDAFIERARVLPLFHRRSKMPLDLVLGAEGLEERFIERATKCDLGGVTVPILSAEDVIVTKMLAGRPKDLLDVEGVLAVQRGALDLVYTRRTLRELDDALGDVELVRAFDELVQR